MKKNLEKLIYITLGAVIVILGWIIAQSTMSGPQSDNNTLAESPTGESLSEAELSVVSEPDTSSSETATEEDPNEALREFDLGALVDGNYQRVFLSMYPSEDIDLYFSYYNHERVCYKLKHTITDLDDLVAMLNAVPLAIERVLFFAAPDLLFPADSYDSHAVIQQYRQTLLPIIRNHPGTVFDLDLPGYSLAYLQSMDTLSQNHFLTSYYDFYQAFRDEPNVSVRLFGALEWLIANPGNYDSPQTCDPHLSEGLLHTSIENDPYCKLTENNYETVFKELENLMRGESTNELSARFNPVTGVCDNSLSSLDIIFFGDSLFGNYTDSSSIPGAVEGLSGAHAYNLGIGGTSASSQNDTSAFSLEKMVHIFLSKDLAQVAGKNAEIGLREYLDEHDRIVFRIPCFVINFGLNDYFQGVAVEYPDSAPDNISTYKGALYSAVKELKEAYPVSKIIINTPTFCQAFNYGTDINSEEGEMLSAYVQAAIETAQELDVLYLDNYYDLGLNQLNAGSYLIDEVHPNEMGRYVIARLLIQKLAQ